jgi:CTP-dependent riboflavin kinase
VSSRFGVATRNLAKVRDLILARTGLPAMAPGTLNVQLLDPYFVMADTAIEADEYDTGERLLLQRCVVRGHRMFIMRPDSHERDDGPGAADVIELVSPLYLRQEWRIEDGAELVVEVEGDNSWWDAGVV